MFSKSLYIEIYMIGHAFQILDGNMEKDFDVAFFPTFVEEND